jgi:hypothetical protein
LSNSDAAVRRYSEGGADSPPEDYFEEKTMPQYLLTIQLPDNYDPSVDDEAKMRDMIALGEEMEAAGVVTRFAGGLTPASNAKSLRVQPNGEVVITDGPYVEAKEHVGGISILECADLDEAVKWARKGAIACRASGEVREIFFRPGPEEAAEQ